MIPSLLLLFSLQDPSDAERIRKLEETVREMRKELDALAESSKATAPQAPPGSVDMSDGFRWKSADGAFTFHAGGRFIAHVRGLKNRPDDDVRTSPDALFIRQARFLTEGTLLRDFGYMMEADFFSSALGGSTATLVKAWLSWNRFKEVQLRVGQFKTPISQERLNAILFNEMAEFSLLTRFTPGFDIGAEIYGTLGEEILDYALAVASGRGHLDNQGRARNDDNEDREYLGRVALNPWAGDAESPLRRLRMGVSGSYTEVDRVAMDTAWDLTSTELNVGFFNSTGGFLDGTRTRFGAELGWSVGPVGVRAEVLIREDEMLGPTGRRDVRTLAWYGQASWLITGEEKLLGLRTVPAHPFASAAGDWGWGAWELAVRVAAVSIDEELDDVARAGSGAGQACRVTSTTAGFTWWATRNVRLSLNLIREDYHEELIFADGDRRERMLGLLGKMQVDI